jgi:drug/metabolite transporter (DMT)-like permease
MGGVTRAIEKPSPTLTGCDPVVLSTAYCALAAIGYTAANVCLRILAGDAHLVWVSCVKELVTVVVVGPWVISRIWRGMPSLPPARSLLALAAAGFAVQMAGNLGLIWALGAVGLSVTIPVALGVSLSGSALLARIFLGEPVTRRCAVAIALLIASIVLLKAGADQGTQLAAAGPWIVGTGVAVAILAGLSYATLTVVIRSTAAVAAPPQGVVFVVTGVGVVTLGPMSLWQLGPTGLLATPPATLTLMLLAGGLNLIAFLAITKGLHLTTIVHANVISASQVAMAAIAGILLFGEEMNLRLVLGVMLTIAGMTLIQRPTNGEKADS